MDYPKMYHVRQILDVPKVEDIEGTLSSEVEAIVNETTVQKGSRIAVTAGSRGVANIDLILRKLVSILKDKGAKPFLIPTMGSHGGGTAEGQVAVLESLNVTEGFIGAPIMSSMEAVEIGRSSHGFPVLADKNATEADGIIVVNRIKPHTDFEGPIQSGLMKMMAIGMGKHKGCLQVHKQTVQYGYREIIPEIGGIILEKLPILFGIGIVENVYDETALIRAIRPSDFQAEEEKLLIKAKSMVPRLPFDELDMLIIDEMGKNVSGTGLDTKVIGRIMFVGEKEPEKPKITRIVVLDLTDESHGNAIGIGLADYATKKLVAKIDKEAMATNAITAMSPEKGRIPIALETDRDALEAAFTTIGAVAKETARVVHIKNTLEMGELYISEALFKETEGRENLKLLKQLGPLYFDEAGTLEPVNLSL